MSERNRSRLTDLSITLAPNELERLLDGNELNNSSLRLFRENEAGDDMSTIGSAINPAFKKKADFLFVQFLEVLEGRTNDAEVFDTIRDLIQVCAGVFDEIEKDMNRSKFKMNINWLSDEMKTWRLLYALYKDRIIVQGDDETMEYDMPVLGGSEKEVIAQLYACNSTLREYQLVVDWLEACYDQCDGLQIGHTIDSSVGWENTLFQLNSKNLISFSSGAEIVSSLDPDAPLREKRRLHALDEEDNMRLSKSIFTEIRRGRIDESLALCKYSGQTWRAAILEGWRLHEDPNYEATNIKKPIEGNPHRDIWKKCAWMMADSLKYDEYTRGIAGALCGHLGSLKELLSCSWDDLLWAYLKVQIDIRVESEIRSCCKKAYFQMPEEYWNSKMSLEQIFNELSVHKDATVRNHAHDKIGIIQRYLILDNISELLQQMRIWIDESDTTPLTAHELRFLAHVVLFMRQIGRVDQEETADRITAAYVECLIQRGDAQLVAFYTASLPGTLQLLHYSKFLEGIVLSSARFVAFKEAINAGLDIGRITRNTVESIRQRTEPNDTEIGQQRLQVGEISAFDKHKINALEWLTFTPSQRSELLWQANAMIRQYLAENKAECVRAVYALVPTDSVTHIISSYGGLDNLPCREECSVKEYLSYRVYIVAIDSFDDWMKLYHRRPKEPERPDENSTFTERVADEQKMQNFYAEQKSWVATLEEQTNITRDALFNVLLMPLKGWLVDGDTPKDDCEISQTTWQARQTQMEKLRSLCIPDVVLLLYKVLSLSGDHKSCVRLADEIAAESRQLYKVYTKHKLAELMVKLTESSLELLNAKLDPWGYPLNM